jgi:hypothetical protein
MHARLPKQLARAAAAALATGALMAAGLVSPAEAGNANGHGKGHCRAFHALGDGVTNTDGTTTATIYRGSHEFGTTTGTFALGATVDAVTSFTGTIVFTNDKGTLTAPVEGTLDTVSGEFGARSASVTGSDGFANVTGKLRVWGTQNLVDGTFTEHLHAKLCVPKKKQH